MKKKILDNEFKIIIKFLQTVDGEMESPTMVWLEDEAQVNCEDDVDVEAARCHLSVSATSHTVVKTG